MTDTNETILQLRAATHSGLTRRTTLNWLGANITNDPVARDYFEAHWARPEPEDIIAALEKRPYAAAAEALATLYRAYSNDYGVQSISGSRYQPIIVEIGHFGGNQKRHLEYSLSIWNYNWILHGPRACGMHRRPFWIGEDCIARELRRSWPDKPTGRP